MAKGHSTKHKKDSRKGRTDRKAGAAPRPGAIQALAQQAAAAGPVESKGLRSGLEATRGPVSSSFRSWASAFVRRQADSIAAEFTGGVPAELFVLAPLTTRTVVSNADVSISVQMGIPIVATQAGGVAPASDRLAIAILRMPQPDDVGTLAMLGLGQAPELPPPEVLFAVYIAGESMRGARAGDAAAWYLAQAIEAGDLAIEPQALAHATDEIMALLRPNVAPLGVRSAPASALDAYEGYGHEADEEVVPLDIAAAPARGGLAGLPSGSYLKDNGEALAPLLTDLQDYVIGLWPWEYFNLDELVTDPDAADGSGRQARIAMLAEMIRRLDDVLGETAERIEAGLAEEGHPPAWIADETAQYRIARQGLRELEIAQDAIRRLGPILFDLDVPPADFVPAGVEAMAEEA